ncbi:hypothetical protein [uncultured Polaribacter sp.]|uniref:HYC_CC_PP family protein n=1 Tax=uncultured Polaribacter sp. TaxID=174711 RepID=UPI002632D5A3|nr:hypothetical protein [uncultured Polaribacter sp.]
MKNLLFKITSFILALLVLFSTFSFTVEKHYCGDFLVDVSFTGNSKGCGMELKNIPVKKKKCCKDEVHHIKGQNELQQVSIANFNIEEQQVLVAFYISYNDLFVENQSNKSTYKDFSPPDIPLDYQVLYQTFLI